MSYEQLRVCMKFAGGSDPQPAVGMVGISLNLNTGIWPLNGLRHPPEGGTSGWFFWAGQELSSDGDFFKPLHVEHLVDYCPLLVPYLALPPGWRFLIAPDYEDVWYDESLLNIDG